MARETAVVRQQPSPLLIQATRAIQVEHVQGGHVFEISLKSEDTLSWQITQIVRSSSDSTAGPGGDAVSGP